MTTFTPFPLLRLQSDAIDKLLKVTDPHELFQLSHVSKKTRSIVKSFAQRHSSYHLKLILFYHDEFSVEFRRSEKSEEVFTVKIEAEQDSDSKIQLQFDEVIVPADISCDEKGLYTVTTHWKNQREGMKKVLRYFTEIFNPILTLFVQNDDESVFTDIWRELEMSKLGTIYLSYINFSDDFHQKILDLHCSELIMFSNPNSTFQYRNSEEPLKLDVLWAHQADWVNLNDILYCKRVVLEKTKLRAQHLNQLLKKWFESDSTLKNATIQMNCRHFALIVDGLSFTPLTRAQVGYRRRFNDAKDGKFFGFQRSDGEKAIVYQINDNFHFEAGFHVF